MRKSFFVVLLAALAFPAHSGEKENCPPPEPPAQTQVPDSGSSSDSLRDLAAIGVVTCLAISAWNGRWCWQREQDTIIKFKGKQEAP